MKVDGPEKEETKITAKVEGNGAPILRVSGFKPQPPPSPLVNSSHLHQPGAASRDVGPGLRVVKRCSLVMEERASP